MTKYIARGILTLFALAMYLMVSLMCYYTGMGLVSFLVVAAVVIAARILVWAIRASIMNIWDKLLLIYFWCVVAVCTGLVICLWWVFYNTFIKYGW